MKLVSIFFFKLYVWRISTIPQKYIGALKTISTSHKLMIFTWMYHYFQQIEWVIFHSVQCQHLNNVFPTTDCNLWYCAFPETADDDQFYVVSMKRITSQSVVMEVTNCSLCAAVKFNPLHTWMKSKSFSATLLSALHFTLIHIQWIIKWIHCDAYIPVFGIDISTYCRALLNFRGNSKRMLLCTLRSKGPLCMGLSGGNMFLITSTLSVFPRVLNLIVYKP